MVRLLLWLYVKEKISNFLISVVALGDKIYFNDVVLNALFSYDINTKQCVKISSNFKKPMGITVAGSKIGIIDAGKRALLEYDPSAHSLNTLFQDKSRITTLEQPWDFYVTPTDVYVSDYKRGAILKISKNLPHNVSVISSAAHGAGAPFLTAYVLAGFPAIPNQIHFMYLMLLKM